MASCIDVVVALSWGAYAPFKGDAQSCGPSAKKLRRFPPALKDICHQRARAAVKDTFAEYGQYFFVCDVVRPFGGNAM